MKKVGKKFTAKQKLKILGEWDGTERGARRVAWKYNCSERSVWFWYTKIKDFEDISSGECVKILTNQSQRPHRFRDPHTKQEDEMIKSILTEYPGICRQELYYRLQTEKAYARSFCTLNRAIRRMKFLPVAKRQGRTHLPYDTPKMPGIKWQIDVKYVPYNSISISMHNHNKSQRAKLYQYTCIDECTRERFTWITETLSGLESVRFMKRCMMFFGYKPLTVQTDHGAEFVNSKGDKTVHLLTAYLNSIEVKHQSIKVKCPWQNGKVERSHRTDTECFYKYNVFTSLADARAKNKQWLIRYNTMRPSSAIGFKTPAQFREQMLTQIDPSEYDLCHVDGDRARAFDKYFVA